MSADHFSYTIPHRITNIKMEQNKFEKPLISRRCNIRMKNKEKKINKVIITSKSFKTMDKNVIEK